MAVNRTESGRVNDDDATNLNMISKRCFKNLQQNLGGREGEGVGERGEEKEREF